MGDLKDFDHWNAIESAGGPLVFMPVNAMPRWNGIDGGDYERACDVSGYLGTIEVGDDTALVIGDEPASTALIPVRSSDSVVVAKWTYAPDAASVVASLRGVRFEQFPGAEIAFAIRSSPQAIFDSSAPTCDITEYLPANLAAGD